MSLGANSLLAFLVATVPEFSFGQAGTDYRCRIEQMTKPAASKAAMEYWQKTYEGKEFTVDRQTGIMAGALKMYSTTKPVVIDPGSDQNSFKAVTTMRRDQGAGAGSNVYFLVVREFAKGPKKPFLFVDNEDTFVGTCEHF